MKLLYRWIDFDAVDDAALLRVAALSQYEPIFDVQLPGKYGEGTQWNWASAEAVGISTSVCERYVELGSLRKRVRADGIVEYAPSEAVLGLLGKPEEPEP